MNLQKLETTLFISVVTLLFFGSFVSADLVYDPETNTYINTDEQQETTQESDDQSDQEDGQEQISSIDSDDAQQQDDETNDETDEEADDQDNNDNESEEDTQNKWTGSLEYMHKQVDKHSDELHDLLGENYDALYNDIEETLGSDATTRLDTLQCLGIVDRDFDFLTDIEITRDKLQKEISIVITDLHSAISSLESKIDAGLLSSLDQNLQIGSLQNKIDGYYEEYVNLIEMYYELSLDEINNADELVDENVEEYQEVIDLYDERVALFEEVQNEYSQFIEESSLLGNTAGASIQSLLTLVDALEVYYMSKYMQEWSQKVAAYIPQGNEAFLANARSQSIGAFSAFFASQADSVLYGLYPIKSLQRIDNGILSLRSAYLKNNGSYDCQAVVENKLVERNGPGLIDSMQQVVEEMYATAEQFASTSGELPENAEDLEEILATAIENKSFENIDVLIDQERARVKNKAIQEGINWLAAPRTTQTLRWKSTVRTALQKKYKEAIEEGKLDAFDDIMQRAYDKLNDKLSSDVSDRVEMMLLAIKDVIEEFM